VYIYILCIYIYNHIYMCVYVCVFIYIYIRVGELGQLGCIVIYL